MSEPVNPDAFEFEKVSVTDARKALDDTVIPAANTKKEAVNWESRRKPSSAESLRTATMQWMIKLPPQIQPRHLQVKYPRVANRIASLWDADGSACENFLDDLLTDKRGGRKGFPLNVAQELASIRDFYFRLHHKGTAWEHVEWS